jgi:hypothetical protein
MSPADGASSNDCAAVKHLVTPQTVRLAAARHGLEQFGATKILFALTEQSHIIVWALPLHVGQFNSCRLSINGANAVAAVQLDRGGLHLRLQRGVLTFEPPAWRDVWTRGDAMYEGTAALLMMWQLLGEFVPPKRGRGERGVSRSSETIVKRNALDAYMAHVLLKNLQSAAGVFNKAIDEVATEHMDLTKIVWLSRYADEMNDDADHQYDPPHYIRKYIQREMKKAE